MNLWIRTQNKIELTKVNDIQIYKASDGFQIINYSGNNYVIILGLYKTKERALEVLDEIEERIMIINTISLVKDSVSLIAYKNALSEEKIKGIGYPYQMPKE